MAVKKVKRKSKKPSLSRASFSKKTSDKKKSAKKVLGKKASKTNSTKSKGTIKKKKSSLNPKKRVGSNESDGSSSWAQALNDIWPQERDYMARPDRFKYVRKLVQPKGCVFCSARDHGPGFESLCLYKNKWAMVVINKYPYNSGHILVIPTRHCGELTELGSEEYGALSELLQKSVAMIKKGYDCQGVNLGMNLGAVAGAGIPDHLHWHIVPRWFGDCNFFPLIAETKALPESLDQVYKRLKPLFEELA